MEIVFTSLNENETYGEYEKDFKAVARRAAEILNLDDDLELSVIFCSSSQIHEINREYRHIDRPTDVITFAMQDDKDNIFIEEEEKELGDIFINTDFIISQAKEYGHSQKREASFLFCHGLLHLLGYDHMKPEEEKEMFALQDEILDELVKR